ncbi:MAG: 50S ribosomal protein L9 [Herpetosiphonaceae bacterium]|nr:MAG: 50S ribosomal protein L9 [Herpetosiphonaceae bacterium]
MKVLLTADVENLGKAGEVKDVSDGYARNYLIPKKFAVPATAGIIKQAQERQAAKERQLAKERQTAQELAARISGQTLRFVARVGEQDRLYGSVTNTDIAERLSQVLGVQIDRRKVELGDPIKRAGIYSVPVRLTSGIEARVNVVVEGEEGEISLPEPE